MCLTVVELFNVTLRIMWNFMFLRFPKEIKTKLADKFSEIVVYGKWFVTPNLFDELTDRFEAKESGNNTVKIY